MERSDASYVESNLVTVKPKIFDNFERGGMALFR